MEDVSLKTVSIGFEINVYLAKKDTNLKKEFAWKKSNLYVPADLINLIIKSILFIKKILGQYLVLYKRSMAMIPSLYERNQ